MKGMNKAMNTIIILLCLVAVIVFLIISYNKANKPASSDDEVFDKTLSSLKYECNLICDDWPDAVFEIEFADLPADGIKEKLHGSLVEFINTHNEKCEKNDSEGYIHYISELGDFKTDPDEMSIHIDFGSADPMVLSNILTLLNNPEYKISRVDVF